METFLGTICAFGFNFAPYQWALCQGQLVPIRQNTALFSLLGVQFGGDGKTTFGLPDLQGRAAIGQGTNTLGSSYVMGDTGGNTTATLTSSNLPPHTHAIQLSFNGSNRSQDSVSPKSGYPAPSLNNANNYNSTASANSFLGNVPVTLGNTGGTSPVSIQAPTQVLNYCIALSGIFPQRP